MKKRARRRFSKPSWLWRWHHLLSAFVFLFGVGMMIGFLQFQTMQHPAYAAAGDNMMGWLWSDPIGWISLNDQNVGACPTAPCGTYGVNVNTASRNTNGFAWNDSAGWICFGDSCAIAGCNAGVLPNTPPPGGVPSASMDAIVSPTTAVDMRGWAKVCNQASKGWISLNCADYPGPPAACTSYAYKVQYMPSTKAFTANTPPPITSLAWNGNQDGTGFGYIDFSRAVLNTPAENVPTSACLDGMDNDLNGRIDCADPVCQGTSYCDERTGNTNAVLAGYPLSGIPMCADGIDNDGDTDIDCSDLGCSGYTAPPGTSCGVLPPANTEPACGYAPMNEESGPGVPKTPTECCIDGNDNDGNLKIDCDDPVCQTTVVACTPAWLQTQFGNVYARQGFNASSSPFLTENNATYCLTTQGTITGFTSETGCSQSGPQGRPITLPKGGTQNYQGTLGKIDVAGILAGRYGQVTTIAGSISFASPTLLNGQIYRVIGNATMAGTSFSNGGTQTARGNGLVFVDGGDLTITGNISYTAAASLTYVRNLASFGAIVTKNAAGTAGGNIIINPTVTQLVGAYFAEGSISTGTRCPGAMLCSTEQPLTVSGLFATRQINFQRNYRDPNQAAEVILFDGRAVANPPPGMSDISKSLPTPTDAY